MKPTIFKPRLFKFGLWTLVWGIDNLERLTSISDVGTLKEDKCVIPKIKLSLQGITTTGCRRGIELILRSSGDRDQGLIASTDFWRPRIHIFQIKTNQIMQFICFPNKYTFKLLKNNWDILCVLSIYIVISCVSEPEN